MAKTEHLEQAVPMEQPESLDRMEEMELTGRPDRLGRMGKADRMDKMAKMDRTDKMVKTDLLLLFWLLVLAAALIMVSCALQTKSLHKTVTCLFYLRHNAQIASGPVSF